MAGNGAPNYEQPPVSDDPRVNPDIVPAFLADRAGGIPDPREGEERPPVDENAKPSFLEGSRNSSDSDDVVEGGTGNDVGDDALAWLLAVAELPKGTPLPDLPPGVANTDQDNAEEQPAIQITTNDIEAANPQQPPSDEALPTPEQPPAETLIQYVTRMQRLLGERNNEQSGRILETMAEAAGRPMRRVPTEPLRNLARRVTGVTGLNQAASAALEEMIEISVNNADRAVNSENTTTLVIMNLNSDLQLLDRSMAGSDNPVSNEELTAHLERIRTEIVEITEDFSEEAVRPPEQAIERAQYLEILQLRASITEAAIAIQSGGQTSTEELNELRERVRLQETLLTEERETSARLRQISYDNGFEATNFALLVSLVREGILDREAATALLDDLQAIQDQPQAHTSDIPTIALLQALLASSNPAEVIEGAAEDLETHAALQEATSETLNELRLANRNVTILRTDMNAVRNQMRGTKPDAIQQRIDFYSRRIERYGDKEDQVSVGTVRDARNHLRKLKLIQESLQAGVPDTSQLQSELQLALNALERVREENAELAETVRNYNAEVNWRAHATTVMTALSEGRTVGENLITRLENQSGLDAELADAYQLLISVARNSGQLSDPAQRENAVAQLQQRLESLEGTHAEEVRELTDRITTQEQKIETLETDLTIRQNAEQVFTYYYAIQQMMRSGLTVEQLQNLEGDELAAELQKHLPESLSSDEMRDKVVMFAEGLKLRELLISETENLPRTEQQMPAEQRLIDVAGRLEATEAHLIELADRVEQALAAGQRGTTPGETGVTTETPAELRGLSQEQLENISLKLKELFDKVAPGDALTASQLQDAVRELLDGLPDEARKDATLGLLATGGIPNLVIINTNEQNNVDAAINAQAKGGNANAAGGGNGVPPQFAQPQGEAGLGANPELTSLLSDIRDELRRRPDQQQTDPHNQAILERFERVADAVANLGHELQASNQDLIRQLAESLDMNGLRDELRTAREAFNAGNSSAAELAEAVRQNTADLQGAINTSNELVTAALTNVLEQMASNQEAQMQLLQEQMADMRREGTELRQEMQRMQRAADRRNERMMAQMMAAMEARMDQAVTPEQAPLPETIEATQAEIERVRGEIDRLNETITGYENNSLALELLEAHGNVRQILVDARLPQDATREQVLNALRAYLAENNLNDILDSRGDDQNEQLGSWMRYAYIQRLVADLEGGADRFNGQDTLSGIMGVVENENQPFDIGVYSNLLRAEAGNERQAQLATRYAAVNQVLVSVLAELTADGGRIPTVAEMRDAIQSRITLGLVEQSRNVRELARLNARLEALQAHLESLRNPTTEPTPEGAPHENILALEATMGSLAERLLIQEKEDKAPRWRRFLRKASEIAVGMAGGWAGKAIAGVALGGLIATGPLGIGAAALAGGLGGSAARIATSFFKKKIVYGNNKAAHWLEIANADQRRLSPLAKRDRQYAIEQYQIPAQLSIISGVFNKLQAIDLTDPSAYQFQKLNTKGITQDELRIAVQALTVLHDGTKFADLDRLMPQGTKFGTGDQSLPIKDAVSRLIVQLDAIDRANGGNQFNANVEAGARYTSESYGRITNKTILRAGVAGFAVGATTGAVLQVAQNIIDPNVDLWGNAHANAQQPGNVAVAQPQAAQPQPGNVQPPPGPAVTPAEINAQEAIVNQQLAENAQIVADQRQVLLDAGVPSDVINQYNSGDSILIDSELNAIRDHMIRESLSSPGIEMWPEATFEIPEPWTEIIRNSGRGGEWAGQWTFGDDIGSGVVKFFPTKFPVADRQVISAVTSAFPDWETNAKVGLVAHDLLHQHVLLGDTVTPDLIKDVAAEYGLTPTFTGGGLPEAVLDTARDSAADWSQGFQDLQTEQTVLQGLRKSAAQLVPGNVPVPVSPPVPGNLPGSPDVGDLLQRAGNWTEKAGFTVAGWVNQLNEAPLWVPPVAVGGAVALASVLNAPEVDVPAIAGTTVGGGSQNPPAVAVQPTQRAGFLGLGREPVPVDESQLRADQQRFLNSLRDSIQNGTPMDMTRQSVINMLAPSGDIGQRRDLLVHIANILNQQMPQGLGPLEKRRRRISVSDNLTNSQLQGAIVNEMGLRKMFKPDGRTGIRGGGGTGTATGTGTGTGGAPVAGQPAVGGAAPAGVVAGQPPAAGQPVAATGQPAAVAGQPSPVAGQPSQVAGQPAPVAGQPAAVAGQPAPGQAAAGGGTAVQQRGRRSRRGGNP